MEENRTSAAKTMTFLFVGGAVLGAVAGLLFAPQSGEATRKEIKKYTAKMQKEVAHTAERTKAGIEAAWEKGRTLLSESKAA